MLCSPAPLPSRDARRSGWRFAALALCLTGVGPLPTRAQVLVGHASQTEIADCFQTVVTDAVLVQDLVCTAGGDGWAAITIAASNITLDLGGHVIFGNFNPASIGVRAENVEGVTIKNGTLDGLRSGIDLSSARDVTVENVTIRNLEADDPEDFLTGMRIVNGQDVLVRDCYFELLPVFHKEAIVLSNGEATFDNIELNGGSVGVNYGGLCQQASGRSRGSVINSRFVGAVLSGILVQCTNGALIVDNEFAGTGDGVTANPHLPDFVTGLTVEGNHIHDGAVVGVHFLGNTESRILNNVIRDVRLGIGLEPNMECPGGTPGPECFYATGNVIADNRVVSNVLDLYHHENAVGNVWQRNACETKQGAEIPECHRPSKRTAGRRLQPD